MIHIEKWHTAITTISRYVHKLYTPESLHRRRLHLVSVECLKVVQITKLARLRYAFSTCKSLMTEESQTVVNVVEKSHVEHYGTNCSASSSFARVAMYHNNILLVS